MEVELFQNVANQIRPFAVLVDPIERVTPCLDRQRRVSRISQWGGTVEIWETTQRRVSTNWLSFSTTA